MNRSAKSDKYITIVIATVRLLKAELVKAFIDVNIDNSPRGSREEA